jgi:GH15 family glucan-1,4-alpha-glucosidase
MAVHFPKISVMGYQPIENYGIIGDMKTVALVGLNGSIDFMCFPEFDSPSVFASLLDETHGGYFLISPVLDKVKNKQLYIPDTNVLLTRFLSEEGVGEIIDFMPVEEHASGSILIRRVTNVRGSVTYRMFIRPRFNYARSGHRFTRNDSEIIFSSMGNDKTSIRLTSTAKLQIWTGTRFTKPAVPATLVVSPRRMAEVDDN